MAWYLSQSKTLQMIYSWALYHEGALVEARTELAKLSDDQEDPNYRDLQVTLGIALGDWNSLSAFVANEYQKREKRSAHDLMGVAQLALHLGSPHAKELTFAAVAKGNDDPEVLAAAYFLASSAGWEGDAEVILKRCSIILSSPKRACCLVQPNLCDLMPSLHDRPNAPQRSKWTHFSPALKYLSKSFLTLCAPTRSG